MKPPDHREAIASLLGHPGYRLLLSEVEASFEDILGGIASAKTDAELLHFGRMFQIFYRMRSLLNNTPESFKEDLLAEALPFKTHQMSTSDPLFPPHRQDLLSKIESAAFAFPETGQQ